MARLFTAFKNTTDTGSMAGLGGVLPGMQAGAKMVREGERHAQQLELGQREIELADAKATEFATQQATQQILQRSKLEGIEGLIAAGEKVFGDASLNLDRSELDSFKLLTVARAGALAEGASTAALDRALYLKFGALEQQVQGATVQQSRNSALRFITDSITKSGQVIDDAYLAELEEASPATLSRLSANWERLNEGQRGTTALKSALVTEAGQWNPSTEAGRLAKDSFLLAMQAPIPTRYTDPITKAEMIIDTPEETQLYIRAIYNEHLIKTLPTEIQEALEMSGLDEEEQEAAMAAYGGMRGRMTDVFGRDYQGAAAAQGTGGGLDPIAAAQGIGAGGAGAGSAGADEDVPQEGSASHEMRQVAQWTRTDIVQRAAAEAKENGWSNEQRRERQKELMDERDYAKKAEASAHGHGRREPGKGRVVGVMASGMPYSDYSMDPEARLSMIASLREMLPRAEEALKNVPHSADSDPDSEFNLTTRRLRKTVEFIKRMKDEEWWGSHNAVEEALFFQRNLDRMAQVDIEGDGPISQWAEQIRFGAQAPAVQSSAISQPWHWTPGAQAPGAPAPAPQAPGAPAPAPQAPTQPRGVVSVAARKTVRRQIDKLKKELESLRAGPGEMNPDERDRRVQGIRELEARLGIGGQPGERADGRYQLPGYYPKTEEDENVKLTSVGLEGRTYAIPTMWDGQQHSQDEAIARARQLELTNFPSWPGEDKGAVTLAEEWIKANHGDIVGDEVADLDGIPSLTSPLSEGRIPTGDMGVTNREQRYQETDFMAPQSGSIEDVSSRNLRTELPWNVLWDDTGAPKSMSSRSEHEQRKQALVKYEKGASDEQEKQERIEYLEQLRRDVDNSIDRMREQSTAPRPGTNRSGGEPDTLREQRAAMPPEAEQKLSLLTSKKASGETLTAKQKRDFKKLLSQSSRKRVDEIYQELQSQGYAFTASEESEFHRLLKPDTQVWYGGARPSPAR